MTDRKIFIHDDVLKVSTDTIACDVNVLDTETHTPVTLRFRRELTGDGYIWVLYGWPVGMSKESAEQLVRRLEFYYKREAKS